MNKLGLGDIELAKQVGHQRQPPGGPCGIRAGHTLIGGAGEPQSIRDRIAAIRQEREAQTSEYERTQLDQRIAKLSGGVAVIKVGAATETELKERTLRVEDALTSPSGFTGGFYYLRLTASF